MNAKPAPTVAKDYSVAVFENVAVSLFELFKASIAAGSPVISDRTFRNCRLEGPVVLLPLSGCEFEATDFGYTGGDIRSLVLRPASPDRVIGALPIRDCKFIGSQFFAVGFTGSETFLNQILALETRA